MTDEELEKIRVWFSGKEISKECPNIMKTLQESRKEFKTTSIFKYVLKQNWDMVWSKLRNYFSIFGSLFYWVIFRTTRRFHIVDTGLQPGYYDKDHLILHSCFNLLKEFVEAELAPKYFYCCDKYKDKIKWWQSESKYIKEHARELALECLDYWNTISIPNNYNLSQDELNIERALDNEIRELYLWWIDIRPNRLYPYKNWRKDPNHSWAGAWEMVTAQDEEDNNMLCRLIKIRGKLWT